MFLNCHGEMILKPRRNRHLARDPASGLLPLSLPPAWLAMALLTMTLLALLCVTGCAPEEKEILVDPELPVAEPYDGGTWEDWPLFASGMDALDVLRLPDGSVLLAARAGTVLHVTAESMENLNLPTTHSVIALAAGPQDQIFALDDLGQCFRRRDGAWILDWPYGAGQWGLDVWCDGKGTVYVAGPIGLVMQEEGGRWTSVSEAVGSTLRSIWAPRDDDVWAVGRWGRVLRYDGQIWKLSTPFGVEPNFSFVTGDDEGRVVLLTMDDEIFYFDTHVWRPLPLPDFEYYFRGVFVFAGKLYAFSVRELAVWDEAGWMEAGEFPESAYCQVASASQAGIDLAGQDGWVGRLTGGEIQTISSRIGEVIGYVLEEGNPLLLTQDGWVIRRQNGVWELEYRLPLGPYEWASLLAKDSDGRLLAGGWEGLWQKRPGGTWESLSMPMAPGLDEAYQLDDGTLLFEASGTTIWALQGDELDLLLRLTGSDHIADSRAVAGSAVDDFWLLGNRQLWHYDGAGLEPVLTPGYGDWGLAYAPGIGLLVYGSEGLFLVERNGTRDLTPQYRDEGGLSHRSQVHRFAVVPGGDWLALDWPHHVLRRLGDRWEELTSLDDMDGWDSPGMPWYAPDVLPLAVDRLCLVYSNRVLSFQDTRSAHTRAGEGVRP
jgi:hypothetical protein